ncbi:hypothetical protein D9M68_966100 [compost metagenome]
MYADVFNAHICRSMEADFLSGSRWTKEGLILLKSAHRSNMLQGKLCTPFNTERRDNIIGSPERSPVLLTGTQAGGIQVFLTRSC